MTLPARSRLLAAFLALATLGGCFADPYAHRLAELDLADTAVVADMASRLAPEDRGIFKTFALRHSARTKFACGNLERHHHGKQPDTVGEAIALTRQWEAEDAARLAASMPPDPASMTPEGRFEYELDLLRKEYQDVADRQANIKAASAKGAYRSNPDWAQSEVDLKNAIAKIETKLAQRP